jgi:hypothetical protein
VRLLRRSNPALRARKNLVTAPVSRFIASPLGFLITKIPRKG